MRQRGYPEGFSQPRRASASVRLSTWSARHARPVLASWLVATVGIFALSLAIGGIRTVGAFGSSSSQTESQREAQARQSGTVEVLAEELDVVVTSSSFRASDSAFRRVVEDTEARLSALRVGVSAGDADREAAAVDGLEDPYAAPAERGFIAPDSMAVRIVGRIVGDDFERTASSRAVEQALAEARRANPDFEIHAYSTSLASLEAADEISRDMDGTILISLPATFLILLVAFGAIVAAGVPLVLAISALLAAFGLFGIFSQTVEPVSPFAGQFIVLIGLAVAIDYSLFTITRFRTERRAGRSKMDAIEAASATSGRAVLFSGIAVMISLAGLFLLPDPLFQSIAIGTIAVIAVSVIGSVVFLPAVLAILGDGLDRGRVPLLGRWQGRGAGIWSGVVRKVMGRALASLTIAGMALLLLASPVSRLKLGEADITILPERVDAVAAFGQLRDHWPMGTIVRLEVALTGSGSGERGAAAAELAAALVAVEGLSAPAEVTTSPDGTASIVSVSMAGSANDAPNWEIVRQVRSKIVPGVVGRYDGLEAWVGGDAAMSLDSTEVYSDGMLRVLVFVLALSFALLLVVFRSIAIPVKAILLNLLATGAAFGSMVLVFQEGWFGELLGIHPIAAIQDFVPVFVFTVLFGLSMDYEVFILTRIKEAHDQGLDSHEAVARGIGLTAGTVTSAAAIMVVVFAIFLTLPLAIARELGLGLAVAVFVDATVIRCVLLPASMSLLGDWNWWLPPFLRWLPAIRVEGEPLDASPEPGCGLSGARMLERGGVPPTD
jgi:uncharacterized membrane protein YdfJ with MMPL/SSD domain